MLQLQIVTSGNIREEGETMLPINVMYDSGLSELEEVAVLSALQEWSLAFHGVTITCSGSDAWSKGSYSSADWFIKNAKKVRGKLGGLQLDADHLLMLLAGNPRRKINPSIDVLITSRDITSFDAGEQLNFVFGLAGGGVSVQSIVRFRECHCLDRFLAIKTLIWHELGHIVDAAADLRRRHTEYKLGAHCTNRGCAMQQGLSVPEWIDNAWGVFQVGQIYCPECLNDIFLAHAS